MYGIHKTCAETATVSRGTSHVTTKQLCNYTTSIDIPKKRRSLIQNHMRQESIESAQEQRIAVYKSDQQQQKTQQRYCVDVNTESPEDTITLIQLRGNNYTDTRNPLCVGAPRLGRDPPSTEECFHRLPVLGAHAVVDEDVEGGVDVGGDLQEPEACQEYVLVSAPRVHVWYEELRNSAGKRIRITG